MEGTREISNERITGCHGAFFFVALLFLKKQQIFNGGFKPPQKMLISIIAIRPVTLRNLARWSQSFRLNLLTLFMALLGPNFIGMENAQFENLGTLGISNGEFSYRA